MDQQKNSYHSELTSTEKDELYIYSLKKMASANNEAEKSLLCDMHNLKALFFLAGEMIQNEPDAGYGFIALDVSSFKSVNEFLGRSAGDRYLKSIGDLLIQLERTRPNTISCHVRADVFCLFTQCKEAIELSAIVRDLVADIEMFPLPYKIVPSFGLAHTLEHMPSVSHMKDCATIALNSIKGKFYANYAFFTQDMHTQMIKEKSIENRITSAIDNGEIIPYIQPKVDMRTGRIVGGEALVRWITKDGMIYPNEFIPVLEKNGFIVTIDKLIWEQVCRFLASLIEANIPPVPVSVNVSRIHIYDRELVTSITGLIKKYKLPKDLMPLELTESAFVNDAGSFYERMRHLRSMGFSLSMDDFGTGYSSINMLKSEPCDEIKIDREFIMDLESPKSRIIVSHIIQMLLDTDNDIICEGVETKEQVDFLLKCGCHRAQGFFYYRPMPMDEFRNLIEAQAHTPTNPDDFNIYAQD